MTGLGFVVELRSSETFEHATRRSLTPIGHVTIGQAGRFSAVGVNERDAVHDETIVVRSPRDGLPTLDYSVGRPQADAFLIHGRRIKSHGRLQRDCAMKLPRSRVRSVVSCLLLVLLARGLAHGQVGTPGPIRRE